MSDPREIEGAARAFVAHIESMEPLTAAERLEVAPDFRERSHELYSRLRDALGIPAAPKVYGDEEWRAWLEAARRLGS